MKRRNMNLHSLLVLLISIVLSQSDALTLDGDFSTENFFKFIKKFGFVKKSEQKANYGYIFGNITAPESFPKDVFVTFAVLDFHHFLEFYSNR